MKKSEYAKGLAEFLLLKDEHLSLSLEQAEQLVEYVMAYGVEIFDDETVEAWEAEDEA